MEKNLTGFVAGTGDEHLLSATTYPVGEWSKETLSFTLDEETYGWLSIGYEAVNLGSGSMPHLFVDYIKIAYTAKEEEVDAIHDISEREGKDDGVYYDLMGRRVSKPTRPGTYIVNGKKVIVR